MYIWRLVKYTSVDVGGECHEWLTVDLGTLVYTALWVTLKCEVTMSIQPSLPIDDGHGNCVETFSSFKYNILYDSAMYDTAL